MKLQTLKTPIITINVQVLRCLWKLYQKNWKKVLQFGHPVDLSVYTDWMPVMLKNKHITKDDLHIINKYKMSFLEDLRFNLKF